jgi:hypothetical protein
MSKKFPKHRQVLGKQFHAMIEEGKVKVKHASKTCDFVIYKISDEYQQVSWTECYQTAEARVSVIKEQDMSGISSRLDRANHMSRQYAFLKLRFDELHRLALDAGLIEHDGKPCEKCGSTNTTERGQRHMTHEGSFVEAWRDCHSCRHNEYRGDRF